MAQSLGLGEVTGHSNPQAADGNVGEGPLVVEIDLPNGAPANSVRLLTTGIVPVWARIPGGIRVEVPLVELHEVIAIT